MEIAKIILSYLDVLIWPFVFLFIVFRYKSTFLKILDRATKFGLPGGFSIETSEKLEETLEKGEGIKSIIKSQRKPELTKIIKKKSEVDLNKILIKNNLVPSPSGLNLDYYLNFYKIDKEYFIDGLRIDYELMTRNLANGFKLKIENREPITDVIRKLYDNGYITQIQSSFMIYFNLLTTCPMDYQKITEEQARSIINLGQTLVDDFIAWIYLKLEK